MGEILRTEGVCKYFGGLKAVDDVSMSIQSGDIFGIIGPNGAGKTTFFNVCSGFYKPTKGKVWFDGQDISDKNPEQIAAMGLARTFQATQLFQYMTVLDNVKIGCHMHMKSGFMDAVFHTGTYKADEEYAEHSAYDALKRAGLEEYALHKAGNLSYGIQRKVEIVRSLVTEPKLLLLDEPAAGMNRMETDSLREFLEMLNKEGQTIALIEHDMRFVMGCCHKILVLNFGKRICEGPPSVVIADEEVQRAYFGSGKIGGKASA